jgi:hypothetical protein
VRFTWRKFAILRVAISPISADWTDEVASSVVLDAAFSWLCKRRIDYADSADVWNVRRRWPEIKPQLQRELLAGQYRFQPLRWRRYAANRPRIFSRIVTAVPAPGGPQVRSRSCVGSDHPPSGPSKNELTALPSSAELNTILCSSVIVARSCARWARDRSHFSHCPESL